LIYESISVLRYLHNDAILTGDRDPKGIDIPMQAIKAYGSRVTADPFSTLALDGGERSASRPGRFA